MNSRIKYSFEKDKKKKKRFFDIKITKKDFLLVLIFKALVSLLTNEKFLEFVVEIVKLIMNRSIYYLKNNSFFIYEREKYYES